MKVHLRDVAHPFIIMSHYVMQATAFCDVVPCYLVDRCQSLYLFHLEEGGSSFLRTLVPAYQTAQQ
jgi:hypothetical protein